MAGAKINTKSKGKDDKSKGNKNLSSNNEENEEYDCSLLRKPVLTSITGFAQARKVFDLATEELKSLLANECDLLYECKVCRNIFRSLANFISHKRFYCKEKFSSSVHSHFVKNTSVASEMIKIRQMEEALKLTEAIPTESNDRIPLTKDITGIVEKLAKIKGRYNFDEQQVTLQKIPNSSIAVFQSHSAEKRSDNMQAQVQELDSILSQDRAVLQKDGSFNVQSSLNAIKNGDSDNDNVIQISDDDDSDDGRVPKCKICDMQFSTQKTFKFHMKYKHLESRLVYPCPDCFEIFSTSWSVYRHLFKVHRKSAAQIRRLREAIQAKAFKMNNPPAFYEKKKNMKAAAPQKITEEERLDQENQAWMDNMESDGELPRCGGCGRTFERRAALAAHTHTCQPRSRALARRPPATESKKIEIQIRKDYKKGPPSLNLMPKADIESKPVTDEAQTASKAKAEKIAETAENTEQSIQTDPPEKEVQPVKKTNESAEKDEEVMETSQEAAEKDSETTENVLEEATMDIIDDKSSDSAESPQKHLLVKQRADKHPISRLPFALQIEKNNFAAFKKRIQQDVDLEKLLCKKCDSNYTSIQDLHDHMAEHYKWMRYACKLCNFKHYDFVKVPEHVKIVHKLKGDSDFYFSTVKAIDGAEALELAEPVELCDGNDESSESRRPSRCSSDSSRLSDDSSSSSVRVETGARKRKMYHNRNSNKRKKETIVNDETDDVKEGDASVDKTINNAGDIESSPTTKMFEENSSDVEELEDKLSKRHIAKQIPSVVSRRPVRKKTKPKNEDFEYDLSNLLKMEAQGYRDSQTVTTAPKITQTKKRIQQEFQNNYDNINKEYIGALLLMSNKAVDKAAAELKTTNFSAPIFSIQKEQRPPNVFAKPMLPKPSRAEKMSPKKDNLEEAKDSSSSSKISKIQDASPINDTQIDRLATDENGTKFDKDNLSLTKGDIKEKECVVKEQSTNTGPSESVKPKVKIPSIVPIKFRRQSLELMKNPIINKNITDFSKAGMKTKILLIKPINRNKDGVSSNTPLKFQTIKLKETNKGLTTNEDKPNDQIVVVKVPKVNRAVARTVPDNNANINRLVPLTKTENINEAVENKIDTKSYPIVVDENNTEKSDEDSVDIRGNESEQNSVDSNNVSNVSQSGTPDLVDKTGCGNEISSIASEASNEVPEPMDIEELGTIGSEILETVSDHKSVSAKSIATLMESTNAKSVLSIPELAVNSIIHEPLYLETVDKTVSTNNEETCCNVTNAIRESTKQDSEPNTVTNGDISSS
ncbi:uncharacterized protein isoform X2 [Choristoneura fumiferana]